VSTITDFDRMAGDVLVLGNVAAGLVPLYVHWSGYVYHTDIPYVFRGEMSASLYTEGAALPGTDLGSDFVQAWWARIGTGATAKTVVVFDIDRDLTFTGADFVIEFAPGTITSVSRADFAGGTFVAIAGDALSNIGLDGSDDVHDIIHALGGNDTSSGKAGNDRINGGAGTTC
jgi:hypothetical protein